MKNDKIVAEYVIDTKQAMKKLKELESVALRVRRLIDGIDNKKWWQFWK